MTVKSPRKSIALRGRSFSGKDLTIIRRCCVKFAKEGRTRISVEICKKLGWKQPNGWLKDRACRDVLLRLERAQLVELPRRRSENNNRRNNHVRPEIERWVNYDQLHSASGELLVVLAKGDESEAVWNHLMAKHHYIGHSVIVGRCLKFLVYAGDRLVAALSLSDPAWAVKDRDLVLKELRIPLSGVANNSRFLILPNVRVPNLASQILSLFAKEATAIWEGYYKSTIICLETYVDSARFDGTSYRAANWVGVGLSKGYRKIGTAHSNGQTQKFVLLYPLRASSRALLYERYSRISP